VLVIVTGALWLVLHLAAAAALAFRLLPVRNLRWFVVLAAGLIFLNLGVTAAAFGRAGGAWNWLWGVRAVDLGTGVSPLLPLIFVAGGFFAWAYFQLKRSHLADTHRVVCPFPASPADPCLAALRKTHREL